MEFGFGSGILTGVRNDSAATLPATPERFGALQDVAIEFNGDVKELFSTQQFPIDTARGKVKVSGKAKVAEIKGKMYNELFFGQTLATGSTKYAYNETTTVNTAALNYTVANSGTPYTDQGVFYQSNGNQLNVGSTATGAGVYAFNTTTGVYTWAAADAGLGLYLNYLYQSVSGFNIAIGNPFMGTTPRFQATLFQQFEGNQVVLQLYACVSTRLTFPTRIDDYVIQDLDFSSFANAAGNIGSWSTTN